LVADEKYSATVHPFLPHYHHADAQPDFRGTKLRLAFGRAKIFSRPRHNVGFSD